MSSTPTKHLLCPATERSQISGNTLTRTCR